MLLVSFFQFLSAVTVTHTKESVVSAPKTLNAKPKNQNKELKTLADVSHDFLPFFHIRSQHLSSFDSESPWTEKNRTLTHILQCSNRRTELLQEERVVSLGTAKVNNLDGVHISDDDIVCLDVQVQDTSSMEVVQTLHDLHDIGHYVILRVAESKRHDKTTF